MKLTARRCVKISDKETVKSCEHRVRIEDVTLHRQLMSLYDGINM